MDKKRINFTPVEKESLLSIVKKYITVVENKSTKAIFVHKKKDIWATITQEFNCLAETGPRTVKQLKILYDNFKRETRKAVAVEHHQNYNVNLAIAKQAAAIKSEPSPEPLPDPPKVLLVKEAMTSKRPQKRRARSVDDLRRIFYLKQIKIADFELKSKKRLQALSEKKLKLEIKFLEK